MSWSDLSDSLITLEKYRAIEYQSNDISNIRVFLHLIHNFMNAGTF
ncbi:hypothetical Protein YC6258_01757 [Gynuella sunshinyii YC6258]|uniref:Uncharacterized protein n=1 Tax=Gynuella sunshinyii YC6258 TaxID=1445510 RepID=A0A0C5V2T5_9GAMM|nr:hypothetical Protein YC6258_01757 [Gynuella sunshinyii YC6258]